MPLLLIMPEALSDDPAANLEMVTGNVNRVLGDAGRCIIVVTEGANFGDVGVLRDSFGHAQFSASERTAGLMLMNHLNGTDRKDEKGRSHSRLAVRCIARLDVSGTHQRRAFECASATDLEEAYKVGANAARLAVGGETGYMSTIIRESSDPYSVRYDKVPLEKMANAERKFPQSWLAPDRVDVTDEFVRYALPLIGGELPRYTSFEQNYAPKAGLKDYTPEAYRD